MQQNASSLPSQPKRAHLYDIDCGKGLIIPFVVFTHLTLRGNPAGNEWYDILRTAFGNFEMPMFMYMSGFVMFYSMSAFIKPQSYPLYLCRRALRFMLPYLLIGLAILLGKVIASRFIFVDNAGGGLMDGLLSLFWNTQASPASSLWYIFVMFLFCLVVPPLLWLTRDRIWPLLVLGIIMYPLPWPGYVFLDKAGIYFVFLILGGLAAMNIERWQAFLDNRAFMLIGIFLASFVLMLVDMDPLWRMAIIGPLSLPALHAFVRLRGVYKSRLLMFLGAYCYAIYLFNTIFIGVTKGIMFHVMSWDGPNFLIFAPVLLLAGISGPVLLKKLVLKHNKFLDMMTA